MIRELLYRLRILRRPIAPRPNLLVLEVTGVEPQRWPPIRLWVGPDADADALNITLADGRVVEVRMDVRPGPAREVTHGN
jgi:hypothetical protein